MNILYYSAYSDIHTGSPQALYDLASNIDRTVYTPSLLIHQDGPLGDLFKQIDCRVHYKRSLSLVKGNVLAYLKSICDFMIFYRHSKTALLHVNGTGWRESAVVAARLLRLPVILHLHNPYPKKDIRGNFNFALADRLVIVSESMRDNFSNHSEILKKIVCIHNGVDLKRFVPSVAPFRESLSVNDGSRIIGFVGQQCHRKGVDLLVRAAAEVLSEYPDDLFVLAGPDGIGEGGYTDKMKRLAVEIGVAERFAFLGKRDDVHDVMNAFDLLVVPSRAEPFGKVVIEAMACGKCVVAAKVGGIPEIIEDGVNGLLVPADDHSALGEAILRILNDLPLRDALALKGLQTARKQFSIEALVSKTQAVYQELLQRA